MALLDAAFHWRGARPASPALVVITVDDATIRRANDEVGYGYPLPRRYYARAIDALTKAGAKTVAFDVLFADASISPQDDALLRQAIARNGHVVLSCGFNPTDSDAVQVPLDLPAGSSPRLHTVAETPQNGTDVPDAVRIVPPARPLADASAALGHFNVYPDPSGELRRLPHLLRFRGKLYPSMTLAAAADFQNVAPDRIRAQPGRVLLGDESVPLDAQGLTPVNWVGGPGSHTHWNLTELLDGRVPTEALRGKLVLIGITALGSYENRATPFVGASPAIELQANALDNLLSNQPLHIASFVQFALLTLAVPLLLGLVFALLTQRAAGRRRAVPYLLLLAPFVLLPVQVALLRHDILLPLGTPLVAGLLTLVLSVGSEWRHESEQNARADAAALALARGTLLLSTAAHMASRERLMQILRTTARDALGAREVVLVFNAASEPDESKDAAIRLAHAASEAAQRGGVPLLLPDTRVPRAVLAQAGVHSAVVAPLPSYQPIVESNETPDGAALVSKPRASSWAGAVVAIDRTDASEFSPRDATLLAAIAQETALALENWAFAAALRGRVEAADRELRAAYLLVAEQNSKLGAAVESIEAALFVMDTKGMAALVNPAAARILRGATPILGEHVVSALRNGDLESLGTFLENAGRERHAGEVMRQGDVLSVQCTPLESERGEWIGMMVVVADVTAQRELDRMKTEFVGYVAHELRSPLSTIMGYSSLLDYAVGHDPDATVPAGQLHEMTAIIGRHCRRMNRMISDLLDLSRLEASAPLQMRLLSFDLGEVCERLVREQRSQLNPQPPIEIAFHAESRPFQVRGDPDRMEQILTNLLSNAVKYSPEGGCITVTLRGAPEGFVLEVSDEGMGLSDEQQARLFGKFYRTTDARSRGIKGNGLGLNLVKQLVEAHGGTIEVHSDRDRGGKGTTFRVSIPQAPVSATPMVLNSLEGITMIG